MKKQGWKWLAAFFLFAVLSVLPVENIWAYDVETEYWNPFGDEDFCVELEWKAGCDKEVLSTDCLGELRTMYFDIVNNYDNYEKNVIINVSSSNPEVIAITSASKTYTAYYGQGSGTVVYSIEGYGVASIIIEIEGNTLEKEILVVPEYTDMTKIEKVDYNSIELTWEKQPGVSGYIIERNDTADASEGYTTFKTTTNDANSMIIDAEWGKRYQYRVMPYINKGSKKIYAEKQGKAMEFYFEKTVAEIKSVKQSGASSLKITWNKVKDATGYKVYRSEYENEDYKCVYTAKANTTSWKQKVTKGQRYYYRVETIYPERKGFSKSVAQLIPKYSAAKIVKLSGIKKLYTNSYDSPTKKADQLYYYVADGNLHIIEVKLAEYTITDYTLNSKGKVIAKKSVKDNLYKVGGIYRASDGKFYVVRTETYNYGPKDKVVIKVIQYSSKWKVLKTAKIKASVLGGREVSFEPNESNCGIDMRDGELYINMSTSYIKDKFYVTTKLLEFKVDCKSMKIEQIASNSMNTSYQQHAVLKDDGLYVLSQERTSVIVSGITDYPKDINSKWTEDVLPGAGYPSSMVVGSLTGGMEVGNKNILVCGAARCETGKNNPNCKDIYLSVTDRETGKTTLKWLTSYNKKDGTFDAGKPRMLKLSEDRYAIIFSSTNGRERKETVEYIVVNNAGKKIYSASYTGMHFTSNSQPILYNGNIVWMEGDWKIENAKTYDIELLYQIPAIYDEDSVVGKTFTYKKQSYKITSKSTVAYTGTKDKKATKIEIPASVTYGYQTYKVTSIGDKALEKNKKLKTVVIGTNIKEIGKSAFSGCKKLTSIEVKSKSLKKIGKSALKGISSKATIKVPKAKLTAYKKLFKGKGQSKKVKLKK